MENTQIIRNIFREVDGQYVDFTIVFCPNRRFPNQVELVLGDGWEDPNLRSGINYMDLWAYDYSLMSEEEYHSSIIHEGGEPFSELYGADLENAKVLVIYLTRKSYRLLIDPDIKTVRDLRTQYIGQYYDYIVVRRSRLLKKGKAKVDEDIWDIDEQEETPVKLELVQGSKIWMDSIFVYQWGLLSENELKRYDFIYDGEKPWWKEETFDEHYGNSDARVLMCFAL